MQIMIDSREKKKELERIEPQLQELGISFVHSKLYCGDYMSLDNARLCIDRKKDLQELCGNVCQQHERFKKELIRANEAGIKLVILIEHGNGIENMEDVFHWKNPRKHQVRWKMVNGIRTRYVDSEKATDGNQLYKSLCTIRDRYNVDFYFCDKNETGLMIYNILGSNYDT